MLDIPLLLGERKAAQEMIDEMLPLNSLSWQWRWFKYWVEYYAGTIQEEELIRRAGPFSNARFVAHYAIAMKSLSLGYREKARRHFEEVVST